MINADTFPALDALWAEYLEEITASQDRHLARLDGIVWKVSMDEMTQLDGKAAARRSRATSNDRIEFLGRWYAGKISDELAAWMAA